VNLVGIGFGVFLVAVGAILKWAVTATVSGVDIHVVGVVLMIAGVAMIVLSFLFWNTWGGHAYVRRGTRREVVREDVGEPY
jgi:hypothetical protein